MHYGNGLRSTSQSSLASQSNGTTSQTNGTATNSAKSKKFPGAPPLREASTSKKSSRENIHNGSESDSKGSRRCESSLSKSKPKSKSTSRQNSIESVASSNHSGAKKHGELLCLLCLISWMIGCLFRFSL